MLLGSGEFLFGAFSSLNELSFNIMRIEGAGDCGRLLQVEEREDRSMDGAESVSFIGVYQESREEGAWNQRRIFEGESFIALAKLGREQLGGSRGRLWGRWTAGPQEVESCGCRVIREGAQGTGHCIGGDDREECYKGTALERPRAWPRRGGCSEGRRISLRTERL